MVTAPWKFSFCCRSKGKTSITPYFGKCAGSALEVVTRNLADITGGEVEEELIGRKRPHRAFIQGFLFFVCFSCLK